MTTKLTSNEFNRNWNDNLPDVFGCGENTTDASDKVDALERANIILNELRELK